MIVAEYKFNTTPRIAKNKMTFGSEKPKAPKPPSPTLKEIFNSQNPLQEFATKTKTGRTMMAGVMALLFGSAVVDCRHANQDEAIQRDLVTYAPNDTADIMAKSYCLPYKQKRDYLLQVCDSLKGGASTPNKTFKTDSVLNKAADELEAQGLSIAEETRQTVEFLEHKADSIRSQIPNQIREYQNQADVLRKLTRGHRR